MSSAQLTCFELGDLSIVDDSTMSLEDIASLEAQLLEDDSKEPDMSKMTLFSPLSEKLYGTLIETRKEDEVKTVIFESKEKEVVPEDTSIVSEKEEEEVVPEENTHELEEVSISKDEESTLTPGAVATLTGDDAICVPQTGDIFVEETDWKNLPEIVALTEREGGNRLIDCLNRKDYSAYNTCIYMYRQYMIDGFGKIGSELTTKLLRDEKLLDTMSEDVATKICVMAGILPKDDEDIRPYIHLYLEHIGYDADEDPFEEGGDSEKFCVVEELEKVRETPREQARRVWKETDQQNVDQLETGVCLKGLLELLEDGEGHILPDHMSEMAIFLSHISLQDDDLFEVCQYTMGKNIEQPLPPHIQERVGFGTEEEREEGRKLVEILNAEEEGGEVSSIQNERQCIIC